MKNWNYKCTSEIIWVGFDFGVVQAETYEEALEKAKYELQLNLQKAQIHLNQIGFTIDMDINQVEVEEDKSVVKLEKTKDFIKYFGKGYTCTDEDNFQFGKQLSETKFMFIELNKEATTITTPNVFSEDTHWFQKIIDLESLTKDEINESISCFYSSVDEIKDTYGMGANWIIAECVFEYQLQND